VRGAAVTATGRHGDGASRRRGVTATALSETALSETALSETGRHSRPAELSGAIAELSGAIGISLVSQR
jgi:hypothetical protein